MTPDKYTAIAEALVNDVDEECSGWGFELTKAIAQAIADAVEADRDETNRLRIAVAETQSVNQSLKALLLERESIIKQAVEAEKAKASVEIPDRLAALEAGRVQGEKIRPYSDEKWSTLGWYNGFMCAYDWLRSHAKIVWGEK